MSEINPQAIEAMHDLYRTTTGLDLKYHELEHGIAWTEWLQHGWNGKDLVLVISYLKTAYDTAPKILTACLRFRHLIRQTDTFAEYLAEAKARARVKKPNADRARTLRATGREESSASPPARSAGDIVKGLELLKRFKEEQGMIDKPKGQNEHL